MKGCGCTAVGLPGLEHPQGGRAAPGQPPHHLHRAAAAAPPPFAKEQLTSVKYLGNPCSEESPLQSGFVEAAGSLGGGFSPSAFHPDGAVAFGEGPDCHSCTWAWLGRGGAIPDPLPLPHASNWGLGK